MTEKIYLSTVTPVYRGAAFLRQLVEALDAVRSDFAARQLPVELVESIFVDDASVDDSVSVLHELQQAHSWIRVVHLSRNFGQHGATVAGILHSSGDWVATLDEDLQHHPKHLLSLLVHAAAGGHDIVYASSPDAIHSSAFRNLSSRFYKRLMSWLSGSPVVQRFSSFRMIRGSVVRAACSVSTHDTYFDVVLSWFTTRVHSMLLPLVDVRTVGGDKSGYTLKTLLRHARRMLISSEIRPLRIGSAIGVAAVMLSVLIAIGIVILKIASPETIVVRGWASLIVAISFFGGLTALLIGVALEYLSTVVLHTLGKPTFFVVDRSKDALLLPLAEQ